MARQNVFEGDRLAGWFDPDRANTYEEDTRWDGSNHISLATGSQWDHERLHRTVGGRWVKQSWSQWQGRQERWEFISDDQVREWLTINEYDTEQIERITGEEMPAEMGRPEIGPQLKVRFEPAAVAMIDEAAASAGMTRSAWIRRAVDGALGR